MGEAQTIVFGHCWRTVAVVEEVDSHLTLMERAAMEEVDMFAVVESQESLALGAADTIDLGFCQLVWKSILQGMYLGEDMCGFQEGHSGALSFLISIIEPH